MHPVPSCLSVVMPMGGGMRKECVSEHWNIIIRNDGLKGNNPWDCFGVTVCGGSELMAIRD